MIIRLADNTLFKTTIVLQGDGYMYCMAQRWNNTRQQWAKTKRYVSFDSYEIETP